MKKNQGASDGPITIMTLLEKVGIKGILIGLFVMFVILEIITLAKGKKTTKEVATPTDAVATLTDATTEAPAVLDFGLADDTLVATSGDAAYATEGNATLDPYALTAAEYMAYHPLLLQKDSRWKDAPYGTSTVGQSGCAPTCLSMAIIGLTDYKYATPPKVAAFSANSGYYIPGQGTTGDLCLLDSSYYGLSCKEVGVNENEIISELYLGNYVILSVKQGIFTDTASGHYILVYGYNENGLRINDPNSIDNSQKEWPLSEIINDVQRAYSLSPMETEDTSGQ